MQGHLEGPIEASLPVDADAATRGPRSAAALPVLRLVRTGSKVGNQQQRSPAGPPSGHYSYRYDRQSESHLSCKQSRVGQATPLYATPNSPVSPPSHP